MRRAAATAIAGAAALAALAMTAGAPAGASCIRSVTHLGAPFDDVGRIDGAAVAGPAGPGTIPVCDDTPGVPRSVAEPERVTLHRVRGVAPRLGVALRDGRGGAELMALAEGPCRAGPAARALACLRRQTRALVEGPSLIAPPSAEAGAVIGVEPHFVLDIGFTPGRALPVRLPAVEPGRYRLAQLVHLGERRRWVSSVIAILPPPPARPDCRPACPHG